MPNQDTTTLQLLAGIDLDTQRSTGAYSLCGVTPYSQSRYCKHVQSLLAKPPAHARRGRSLRCSAAWENRGAANRQSRSLFALFYEFMPAQLAAVIDLARYAEPDLFPEGVHSSPADPLYADHFTDPDETPYARFCRLSDLSGEEMLEHFETMHQSSSDFVNSLLGATSGGILLGVDHLIRQLPRYSIVRNLLPQRDARRSLVKVLAAVGCSLSRTASFTGYQRCRLGQFYKNRAALERAGAADERCHAHLLAMRDPSKARLIMLFLSLYALCLRVLRDEKPSEHPLCLDDLGSSASPALAAGCYLSVIELTGALDFREWQTASPGEVLPDFNSCYSLLQTVCKGRAQVVWCCDCNTPYLKFDKSRYDSRYNELADTVCPSCGCEREYCE
jgi:hypothetical protein